MATAVRLDDLLEYVGDPGKYQLLLVCLCTINWFYFAFNHMSLSYYNWTPDYHCLIDDSITHYQNYKIYKIDSCNIYTNHPPAFRKDHEISCGEINGWTYTKHSQEQTVVTEWNMICRNSYFITLSTSVYFMGLLLGGLVFRLVADRFGRKKTIICALLLSMVLNFCLFFVSNFIWFTILRFVIGFLLQGIQNTNYFLLLESICTRWRFIVTTAVQIAWSLGIMCLAGLVYIIKDWRYIQLVFGFHGIICIIISIFLPESVRWLIAKGRSTEFNISIQRIAKFNGCTVESQQALENVPIIDEFNNNQLQNSLSLWEVLKTARLRNRVIRLVFVSFSCGMIYMGLTLDVMQLPGNKYLNLCLTGAVEIPSKILTSLLLKRYQRRNPLLIFLAMTSVIAILAGITPHIIASSFYIDWLVTLLCLLTKSLITGVISINNVYVKELFPLFMRTVGLRFYSTFNKLGNCFSVQILFLSHHSFPGLSSIIFGVFAALSLIILFFTPETSLPDSLEDIRGIQTYPKTEPVKETSC